MLLLLMIIIITINEILVRKCVFNEPFLFEGLFVILFKIKWVIMRNSLRKIACCLYGFQRVSGMEMCFDCAPPLFG